LNESPYHTTAVGITISNSNSAITMYIHRRAGPGGAMRDASNLMLRVSGRRRARYNAATSTDWPVAALFTTASVNSM
jgi:hypothetical protein